MKKSKGCTSCNEPAGNNTSNVMLMLKHLFPLLKNDYRELLETELESEDVFKELFPDKNKIDLGLLKAVFEYQKLKKAIN